MPGNTDPLFSKSGLLGGVAVSAANTRSDGVGTIATDIFKVASADASNGSFIREVRWNLELSVTATASLATMLRVFLSSVGSGSTTQADTHLFSEISVGAQTPSGTVAQNGFIVPFNFVLPAGWHILVTNHHAPNANTKWKATAFGGNF